MLIQTWHPKHPLFTALAGHSFEAFAESQLKDREMAGLPPFVSLALLRAEAKDVAVARDFLQSASELAAGLPGAAEVLFYPPVPTPIARVANVERMQMLVESSSRTGLQRFLALWLPQLPALRSRHRGLIRWAVDVDPLAI
jgi:primosomal protein N' (replication factor Y)